MKRRGFSLIELLVVIALLTVLGTLTVMAIGHMRTTAKRQQTQLTLQNLQNMFGEWDRDRRLPFGASNLTPSAAAHVANSGALTTQCPGDVSSTDPTSDRFGPTVLETRYFMAQLMTSPVIASSIGKLPPSELLTFVGQDVGIGSGASAAPPPPWSATTVYAVGQPVTYTDATTNTSNIYIRTHVSTDQSGVFYLGDNGNGPPNAFYWLPGFYVLGGVKPSIPVVLDGWGNPIIFCMGGVLGNVSAGGHGNLIHSSDYRPFWASAGPDGNFGLGDDNLYSFEK